MKSTVRTYKLLRLDEAGLHPLFIDAAQVLPIGEWIEARSNTDQQINDANIGYNRFGLDDDSQWHRWFQTNKPTIDDVEFATISNRRWVQVITDKRGKRRVYDLGIGSNGQVLRFAHRPGWHSSREPSLPTVSMDGRVWAECLIPADDYYIHRANVSGLTKTREPLEWFISKRIMIERIITPT